MQSGLYRFMAHILQEVFVSARGKTASQPYSGVRWGPQQRSLEDDKPVYSFQDVERVYIEENLLNILIKTVLLYYPLRWRKKNNANINKNKTSKFARHSNIAIIHTQIICSFTSQVIFNQGGQEIKMSHISSPNTQITKRVSEIFESLFKCISEKIFKCNMKHLGLNVFCSYFIQKNVLKCFAHLVHPTLDLIQAGTLTFLLQMVNIVPEFQATPLHTLVLVNRYLVSCLLLLTKDLKKVLMLLYSNLITCVYVWSYPDSGGAGHSNSFGRIICSSLQMYRHHFPSSWPSVPLMLTTQDTATWHEKDDQTEPSQAIPSTVQIKALYKYYVLV